MDAVGIVLLGLPMTLLVTALAFAMGLVGGVPIMLGLRSRFAPVRIAVRVLVDLIRGVPPLVWLFLLYFGVSIGAVRFDSLTAAVLALGIISSAYLAEIYRGGFATLSGGQAEAAAALGLSRTTTFGRILAPQALRTALPSMTAFLLSLVKDSSLASTIGVADMVFQANLFTRQNMAGGGFTAFFVAAGVYLAISVPVAILARRLDTKMQRSR